jgi:hypothetical protein
MSPVFDSSPKYNFRFKSSSKKKDSPIIEPKFSIDLVDYADDIIDQ